jgi:stress response protein YsnF
MSPSSPHGHGSNYQRATGHFALSQFDVYSDRHERVAKVIDGLQNASGELQYLVVEFVAWEPGKQLLIPVHLAEVDLPTQRLYVPSLNRQQVLATPAYNHNYESPTPSHAVQPGVAPMRSLEQSAPLEASAPLEGYAPAPNPPIQPVRAVPPVSPGAPIAATPPVPGQRPVSHIPPTRPPADLPTTPATQPPAAIKPSVVQQEEVIPLHEERLIVDQKKQKVGEVVVRKEIETEIIQVPVQREKLIVEQVGEEPQQLAEIDLTDNNPLPPTQRREAQLPPLPDRSE